MAHHGRVTVLRKSARVHVGTAQVSSGPVPDDQHARDVFPGHVTPPQFNFGVLH